MRVLVVSHHGLPHVGGVEVLVDAEIQALAAAGHSVVHVTSDLLGQAQAPAYPPGVRVVRVPALHLLEHTARLAYPLFHPKLWRLLEKEVRRADVVHAHGFIFLTSVAALILAKRHKKPTRLTDHGGIMPLRNPLLNFGLELAAKTLGRVTTRRADLLVAYNQRVLHDLETLAGSRRRSLFLPYPVRTDLFHPPTAQRRAALREALGWTDGRPRVLFVGRITADKGVLLLLEALAPEFELVICGPGDPNILGLPRPQVQYLPPRPQEEIAKLYQAADLLALPSRPGREGFPLVVREALACGIKVVMSYEWGYQPYRRLPNLRFAENLEPAMLRKTLLASLNQPFDSTPAPVDLCPTQEQWLARLYNLGETGFVASPPAAACPT